MLSDIRFALRYLRRKPLATTTIVLVLALGIGANSALFSLLQSITLRGAPGMSNDDRVVQIFGVQQLKRGERLQRLEQRRLSYAELQRLATHSDVFSAVAGHTGERVVLGGKDVGARDISATFVTSRYFATIGVTPAAGQGLRAPRGATDDALGDVDLDAVISYAIWERLFAKSDTAIGSVIRLNGVDVRVVGVAPHRFIGPLPSGSTVGAWLPLSARARILNGTPAALTSPDSLIFTAFARLAPGVSEEVAAAAAQSAAVAANSWRAAPEARDAVWGSRVFGLRSWGPMKIEEPDIPLMFAGVWSGALLILLIACMNVSSLLVAQAVSRRHEIAVRLSLGASRGRVVRQLLTESSIVAVAGGLLALVVYWACMRVIQSFIENADLMPDIGTLLFTMAFSIGTGILFGMSPALHATHGGFANAMRDAGMGVTRRSRLQSRFVVAQIALTQPMLIALGVLLWLAIGGARQLPNDRVASRVITGWFDIGGTPAMVAAREAGIRRAMDRLTAEGQITAVVPRARFLERRHVRVISADRGTGPRAEEAILYDVGAAAPGWFGMLEVPIMRGRDVQLADTIGPPALVIPSTLARAFWGDADPIGRRLESEDLRANATERVTMTVVGVYDASVPTTDGDPRIYTAYRKRWSKDAMLVRTNGPAAPVLPRFREVMRAEAPEVTSFYVRTLQHEHADTKRETRLALAGVAAAGGLALLLASIGLYGVVALSVGQRRREIGVRIAVGGSPMRVAGMFFASGVRQSAIGLAIGLPLSVVGLKLVASTWPDAAISPSSPLVIGAGVALTVLAVASTATWLPARKAATVNPAEALRVE